MEQKTKKKAPSLRRVRPVAIGVETASERAAALPSLAKLLSARPET